MHCLPGQSVSSGRRTLPKIVMPRWQVYNVTTSDDSVKDHHTSEMDLEVVHEMASVSSASRYARRSASPSSSATSTAGVSSCGGGTGMTRGKELVPSSPPSSPSRNASPANGSTDTTAICGWVCACILGAIAWTFLLVIYLMPTQGIFPVMVQLYQKPDRPNVRQGRLQVYPGYNSSVYVHTISLDPLDAIQNSYKIFDVVQSYPVHNSNEPLPSPYVHCWFSNPKPDEPCFFDKGWLGDLCSWEDAYGYNSSSAFLDPCFLIRIEDTGTWVPKPMPLEYVADSWRNEHDPAFLGLGCRRKDGERSNLTFERRPLKGFSIHFFPVTTFAPEYYLPPAVMVKVRGVPRHSSVTIHCWIRTHNKNSLTDSGYVVINFAAKRPGTNKPPYVSGPSTRSGYNKTPRVIEQPHAVPTSPATVTDVVPSSTPTLESTNTTVNSTNSEVTSEDSLFMPPS